MKSVPLLPILITFLISIVGTGLVRHFALRMHIVDHPSEPRKRHAIPTPLLGGISVIVACVIGVLIAWPHLVGGYLLPKHLIGLILGSLIIGVGGLLDDRYTLPPQKQFIFPILAAAVIIASGIGIEYIRNPFGDAIQLDQFRITLFTYNGLPYAVTLLADLFTFVWLMGMMYTTKFLDGVDGLVSGIVVIGACVMVGVSLSRDVVQPETALIALIVAAAFLGFLFWNWNPARIFLGEGGSVFAGFILGILGIISGSKVATTLLIVGIPVLDVMWVIVRRVFIEKRSPFRGDRTHLHLRLIDSGFSQRQAVLFLYALTMVFGVSSLFFETKTKMILFIVLPICMIVMTALVLARRRPKI